MLERVWDRTLLYSCWECNLIQPPQKTVWRFLKKLEIELPHDPAILYIYPIYIYPQEYIWKSEHVSHSVQLFVTQ